MKRFIKRILAKSRLFRFFYNVLRIVYNKRWFDVDPDIEIDTDMFNEKSGYLGYRTDYYNLLLETDKEREQELKRTFYKFCKYYLDLDNPTTFNEKIQWLKLYYVTPLMEECVDKSKFKGFVEREFGKEYVVPHYGFYYNENDIDFESLPSRYVLKSNLQSDARHIIVVKNKERINLDLLKTVLSQWLLPYNTLINSYCRAYRNAKPCIIVEEYLGSDETGITDYKFYCYNGKCRHFLVCKDRGDNTRYINYDMNMNCFAPSKNSRVTKEPFERTEAFDKMLEMAEKVASNFPFVRVDYYYVDGRIYVGELTFYPGAGYNTYEREWDERFGSYLVLPPKTNETKE